MRVNGDRLWSRLMQMAEIGATPRGGCNRQALTDADMAGRNLLSRWAEAAGCGVRVDAVGNLFVHRAGREDSLPVVMTGSHLDTQPTGGKFDGVYGVLAGLEVIESLNDHAMTTLHPIELAVWCNEEGSRFPMAMMGSAVWSGRLPLDTAYGLTDRAGISVRHELQRAGVQTGAPLLRQAVKASFELHIEQGPVLEQMAKTIGVVTGVQHMSRHEVIVEGQEAHAGPTPMSGHDFNGGGRACCTDGKCLAYLTPSAPLERAGSKRASRGAAPDASEGLAGGGAGLLAAKRAVPGIRRRRITKPTRTAQICVPRRPKVGPCLLRLTVSR